MELVGLALMCGAISLVSAGAATGAILAMAARRNRHVAFRPDTDPSRTVILIDDERIVDATPAGRAYIAALGEGGWSLDRLRADLVARFSAFEATLATLPERRRAEITSNDNTQTMELRAEGRRRRVTLREAENHAVTLDRACHAALEGELAALRAIGDALPHPIWRLSPDGRITWANAAYVALAAEHGHGDEASWPPGHLFEGPDRDGEMPRRMRLLDGAGADGPETGWYDCHLRAVPGGTLVAALPADAQIRAERSLRDFVRTFSQTFAHLTVGMAVFNRQRRLMLFNPALTDLTQLPVHVLQGQPTLHGFLDALRARNMMPEPRNYVAWRRRVAAMERGMADGSYSEMWHLADSRVYRVSGRPQPDGAFALLMEDISAEIGLTRRFRTQIETGHAVMDALGDAVAVFDRAGILTLSNASYDRLWGASTGEGIAQLTADQAVGTWRLATAPSPVWDEVRNFLGRPSEHREFSEPIQMRDGRALQATFSSLPDGAAMVRFVERVAPGPTRAIPRLSVDRPGERLEA